MIPKNHLDATWDAAWDEARDDTRDAAWAAARDATHDSIKLAFKEALYLQILDQRRKFWYNIIDLTIQLSVLIVLCFLISIVL